MLRDYQIDATNAILKEFKTKRVALLQLDTGLGKTVIFTEMLKTIRDVYPNFRALVLVNDVKLIPQTIKKFDSDIVGVMCATLSKEIATKPFTVASVQTLVNRDYQEPGLIIVDECDQETAAHKKIIQKYPGAKILGVTATPFNNKGFIYGENKFWPSPCYRTKKEDREKYLCPLTYKGSKVNADFSGLYGKEYNLQEAAERYEDEIITAQVNDLLKKASGRKYIAIICCNIDHLERIHKQLPAAAITHSKLSTGEQARNLELFSSGKSRFLISVNQVSRGYDEPKIDCIAIMRPTRSLALYAQIVGRGRRLAPSKKDCLILDYGKIIESLGFVEDIEKAVVEKPNSNLKLCPLCDNLIKTSVPACDCGFEFFMPQSERRKRDVDYLANLTYESFPGYSPVSSIDCAFYSSKKGNRCLLVRYWNGFEVIASEFYMDWNVKGAGVLDSVWPRSEVKNIEELKVLIDGKDKICRGIRTEKSGKYKKIIQRIWD